MTDAAIRIVAADDHRMFVEALAHLFENTPGATLIATTDNGDDLIAVVRRHRPDVAIVDVSMRGPGIVDLIGAIKANCADCRIVVLTMHLEALLASSLLDAGADGYVVKDAAFKEMLTAVRKVANGERFVSSQVATLMARMKDDVEALTRREAECLRAAADGMTNKMIGRTIGLSERTVRFHFENICRKLDASRRGEAIAIARRRGLL